MSSTSYRLQVRNKTGVIQEGTGWFLEHDLVVTAFHVVGSKMGRGWLHQADEEIRYNLLTADNANIALRPALFDARADVAMLVAEPSTSAVNLLALHDTPAKPGQTWSAEGFPQFHQGKPFTLDGTVTAMRDKRQGDALQLTVNQHTDVPWEGMSGSPLIID